MSDRQHFHAHLNGAFGPDRFGHAAESFARFFGTPQFLIGQTIVVIAWIVLNVVAVAVRWDPYPFILLNLLFSTQAAYAAPLILLASTRQADRDKAMADANAAHRDEIAARQDVLLTENTELTRLVHQQTARIEHLQADLNEVVKYLKEIHGSQ